MTHFTLTTVFSALFFFSVNGQSQELPKEDPYFYKNSFLHQLYIGENVDSCLYFARLLAANQKYSPILEDLLHNDFAQEFIKIPASDPFQEFGFKRKLQRADSILNGMMSDTNINLVTIARPIYFWVSVQHNENNSKKLITLTNEFIKTELLKKDIYEYNIGRYALLIYQIISQKAEFNKLSKKLFTITIGKLKSNQMSPDSLSTSGLIKRAWFRYLYAYANFIRANQLIKLEKNKEAAVYFKLASVYSPDLACTNCGTGYYYNSFFFFLGKLKTNFQDDYLTFLSKSKNNKEEILSTLLAMALTNTDNKEKLHSFYDSNFSKQEVFSTFWIKSINKNLKKNTDFSLKQINGNVFLTADNKSKWVLIDFWGTWCAACRQEHPDLQKLYQSIKTKDTSNLVILTVACHDNESEVISYMKEHKYSFPVAMADKKIEDLYNINGYPSKILITPQGNCMIIPFGLNWVDFIKNYADL